jgi:hypothetical protein
VIRNKYLFELDYEYDIDGLLDLYNRHKLVNYEHQVTGRKLGFSHCYTKELFEEPVVQKIIEDFKYLNLKFEFGDHCASAGFTLCESRMTPDCTIIPHIDNLRPCCLTLPLTFPQIVQFYEGDKVVYEYEYTKAIIGNVGRKKHGVPYSPELRRQFQLDVFNTWDEVNEIFEAE